MRNSVPTNPAGPKATKANPAQIAQAATADKETNVSRLRWWASRWTLVLAIIITVFLAILCIISPFIPFDPIPSGSAPPEMRFLGPSIMHLFGGDGHGYILGTDGHGRDMLTLLVKGTEAFALPGLLASILALLIGVPLGALAGYMGGFTDKTVTFMTTVVGSFPRLVFVLLACTIPQRESEIVFLQFTPDMLFIGGLVGFLFIPQVADAIRRRVLSLKAEDYIEATIAHGVGKNRLLFYHIVWLQCFTEIIRQALYIFCYLIFLETALAFLDGPGVAAGMPSWGTMLAGASAAMMQGQFWHAMVPTVAIVFTTLAITAVGDVIVGRQREERL